MFKVGDYIMTVKPPHNYRNYNWCRIGKVFQVKEISGDVIFYGSEMYGYTPGSSWEVIVICGLSRVLWAKEIQENV
jgi:hypothetical protein